MEVKSKAKYIRISPRKARLVVNLIRKMSLDDAYGQLNFINKGAAEPVKKLLDAAVADAKHNFYLDRDNLFIKSIIVGDGPSLKRWQPKAFGRATPIQQMSCHLEVVLAEKVPTKDNRAATKKKINIAEAMADKNTGKKKTIKEEFNNNENKEAKRSNQGVKGKNQESVINTGGKNKNLVKKIFNRKTT